MNKQQLRARLFGAIFAGVVGFGATITYANEVGDIQEFDSVDEAFAGEAQDHADLMDMAQLNNGDAAAAEFGHHPGHPGHPGHPHPYPHPYPHPVPYPVPVPVYGRFVCVAQNLRRAAFYGSARYEVTARQIALNNCYAAGSANCQVVSCQFTN